MQETEIWQQKYIQARNNLRHYYKHTDREGFRFAFNDLPPFVCKIGSREGAQKLTAAFKGFFGGNGAVGKGPFYDLMKDVSYDLETKPNPMLRDWSEFAEGLARRDYSTVAAPIMPVHNRAFQIVNLIELRCGALFFSQSIGQENIFALREHTHKIFLNVQSLQTQSRDANHCAEVIDSELRSIARIGNGFAVGRFYFEQLLLQRMNGPISLELAGLSLVNEAKEAADDQRLCLIDFSTLRQIEDRIGTSSFLQQYDYVPLFGDPIPIPAGLPFIKGEDIGLYLWYRWRHEEPNRFEKALESLTQPSNGHITPAGSRLIDRTKLPVGMEHPGILTTSSTDYLAGIASLVYESHLESYVAEQPGLLVGASPRMPLAFNDRALPESEDRILELQKTISQIEERADEITIRSVQEAILEEAAARKYVAARYQTLIDRKYLEGLSKSESEEVEGLKTALDEMDEPYYNAIIKRLRELTEQEQD